MAASRHDFMLGIAISINTFGSLKMVLPRAMVQLFYIAALKSCAFAARDCLTMHGTPSRPAIISSFM